MGEERQQSLPRVSRRAFFREGGKTTAAVGAAALLAKVGTGATEAASPAEDIKHLEEFPGINFHPIQIEGESIKDSLATGPKGFWFHAKNGQRIEAVAGELDEHKHTYIESSLYNALGFPVEVDRGANGTRTEVTIPQTGDYFLVVRKAADAQPDPNRFEYQVREALEHGIQESFLLFRPEKNASTIVRFPPEIAKIFPDGEFGVILDFNDKTNLIPSFGFSKGDGRIGVYVQKGGPEQVRGDRVSLPENNPANGIIFLVNHYDDQRVVLFPIGYPNGEGIEGQKWPSGSHIAVVVRDPADDNKTLWVTRFFTLEKKPTARPKAIQPESITVL
ncbi:hypothetical protein HYT17_02030 [Candidatus Microgenomates bacterium]|nr:hypothetical protein [Candidatus Microgenomates bacterium]